MSRADMRLKLLEQMVLDRDARIKALEQEREETAALAIPHADFLALSKRCALRGGLLHIAMSADYLNSQAYRCSIMRDISNELAQ